MGNEMKNLTDEQLEMAGGVYRMTKNYEEAIRNFESIREKSRSNLMDLAICYEQIGDYQKAVEVYQKMDPSCSCNIMLLGRAQKKALDFASAEATLKMLVGMSFDPLAFFHLGIVQALLGKSGEASESFEKAMGDVQDSVDRAVYRILVVALRQLAENGSTVDVMRIQDILIFGEK